MPVSPLGSVSDKTFDYLLDLIGKKIDNPLVQRHLKRFPWLNVKPHSSKESVILEHPDGLSFTPEETAGHDPAKGQSLCRNCCSIWRWQ